MNLVLQRDPTVKLTTFGELSINGEYFCHTLEDVVREQPGVPVSQWKVKGQTAIPVGRYTLSLVNSPKFGPDTLTLDDVPGFLYIRIHSGNDDADTEGCILVGEARVSDLQGDGGNLVRSKAALRRLKAIVVPAIQAGESVVIDVRNP